MLQAVEAMVLGLSDQARLGVLAPHLSPAVEDLRYAAWRAWGLTQVRLARLVKRPPDRRLVALLAVAFSCLQRQYRDPAVVVDQSVRAARELGREPAARFVNGLLRRVLADPEAAQADLSEPMAQFNVPPWWHDRLVSDWGLPQAHAILRASQARPPLCLRLMGTEAQQQDTQARMRAAGLQLHVHPEDAACVWVHPPRPVQQIPGFEQGLFRVQDAAAQTLARHLGLTDESNCASEVWLDACAAPGGKTFLMAEQSHRTIWAVDQSAARMARLETERIRLADHLQGAIETRLWDWTQPGSIPGLPTQFDGVVLDAPCSASGVVRHHPEIPWRQSETALAALVARQATILDKLWQLLKPGGHCWLITCSVFRAEGEDQAAAFQARWPQARRCPSPGHVFPSAETTPAGMVVGHDGFFHACFEKLA